jgi:endonuclease YncB( thermonuclease family)
MQILLSSVLVAVAAVQPSGSLQRSETMLVRKVIDGATIDVAPIGRVHLLGVTAVPGSAARDRLASLVLQRWVRLEYDAVAAGSRRQAYVVRDDGVFVNAEMVRDGMARVTGKGTIARLSELQRAERDAQARRAGIWARP